jgi:hypothetical protein
MAVTPEQIEHICMELSEGKSLRSIARALAIPESTIRYYIAKDEAAFAHSVHARELGCDALADECLEIADEKGTDPAEKRIRIETRIRLIGKWSQRYSDKVTLKNETTVTHRYDLDKLSTDKLEQLETILSAASRSEGDTRPALPSSVH